MPGNTVLEKLKNSYGYPKINARGWNPGACGYQVSNSCYSPPGMSMPT